MPCPGSGGVEADPDREHGVWARTRLGTQAPHTVREPRGQACLTDAGGDLSA